MERDSVTALFAIRDNRGCTCLLISCVRRNCVGCIEEAVVQCRSLKHRVAVVTRMRRQSRKGVEKGGGQRDSGVASVRFPLTRDLYIVSNLCHGKWNVSNVEKYRRTDHFLRLIPLSLSLLSIGGGRGGSTWNQRSRLPPCLSLLCRACTICAGFGSKIRINEVRASSKGGGKGGRGMGFVSPKGFNPRARPPLLNPISNEIRSWKRGKAAEKVNISYR